MNLTEFLTWKLEEFWTGPPPELDDLLIQPNSLGPDNTRPLQAILVVVIGLIGGLFTQFCYADPMTKVYTAV